METVEVADFRHASAYLVGRMAYPAASEVLQAERAAGILAAHQLARRRPADFDWSQVPEEISQILCIGRRPPKDRLVERLNHRMFAAQVAGPLVARELGLELPKHAPASLGASIDQALADREGNDDDNFKGRIWRRSFPMLHYALAFAMLSKRILDDGNMPHDGIIGLASSRVFFDAWLRAAAALKPVIEGLWPKHAANNPLRDVQFAIAA